MIVTVRPVIDLDLGHACQYGYHQPPIRVVDGPPALLDTWNSRPRIIAAVAAVLADGAPRSTIELADELGLTTHERQCRLWPALGQMTRRGEVRRISSGQRGRIGEASTWKAAA